MRIQDLAIIFVIIILPISIVLGAYTQMEIKTISIQTEYDMKLTAATSDAIKAFQINTANSSTSDIANSKIRDIEASVSVFKASIKSVFGMNGYSEDEMNEYIPALVYTMYDGFYIYSKFNNQNYLYETEADGTYKLDASGNKIPLDKNGQNIYGLKPYITYSAEYVKGNTDVVITYSLDNYIAIKGLVDGTYWNESGYLVDGITEVTDDKVTYNGIDIEKGIVLKEYLPKIDGMINEGYYKYIRYNGTKYYLDEDPNNPRVMYFLNGNIMELKPTGQTGIKSAYETFKEKIQASDSAYNFYKTAKIFTDKVKNSNLVQLTYGDAQDYVIIKDENNTENNGKTEKIKVWENDTTKIFDFNPTTGTKPENNIECEKSNFNQHRLAIIKNKIRTNLAIAIANFNSQNTIEFQMPELTDEDWAKVMNNIAMISFVQGIEIGGKTYNGYTIINNSESKEVVREENIYILGKDNFYHRIGDKYLNENSGNNIGTTYESYNSSVSAAGRLNLDFNRQYIYKSDGSLVHYYPLNTIYASYNSIVSQNYWDKNYDDIDDIYAYVAKQNNNLKKAFYTALGREREASKGETDYKKVLIIGYHPDNTNSIEGVIKQFTNTLNAEKDINATYICSTNSGNISEYIRQNKKNYDLIVLDAFAWDLPITQQLIDEVLVDTNIFTIGNDSNGYSIFKESRHYNNASGAAQSTDIGAEVIGDFSLTWSDSSQWAIKFKDDVKVLYKALYNGSDEYDLIGLKGTGNRRWLHSQVSPSNSSTMFKKLVDCVLNGI